MSGNDRLIKSNRPLSAARRRPVASMHFVKSNVRRDLKGAAVRTGSLSVEKPIIFVASNN